MWALGERQVGLPVSLSVLGVVIICGCRPPSATPSRHASPLSASEAPSQHVDELPNCPRLAVRVSKGKHSRAAVITGLKAYLVAGVDHVESVSWARSGVLVIATATELWVARVGRGPRSGATRLTSLRSVVGDSEASSLVSAVCSPVGDQVAVSARGRICLMDWTQAGATAVAVGRSRGVRQCPAWSPDGRWLVYQSFVDARGELRVYDTEQRTESTLVRAAAGRRPVAPVWGLRPASVLYGLWQVRAVGHQAGVDATILPGSLNVASFLTGACRQLMGDDERVRGVAWRPGTQQVAAALWERGIWIVAADGLRPRPLGGEAAMGTEPAWSSDGEWLAFGVDDRRYDTLGVAIRRMSDGREWHVDAGPGHSSSPAWEPPAEPARP